MGDRSVVDYRLGTLSDAPSVSALAIQVFLGTYSPSGVRPDIAREALSAFAESAVRARLAHPSRTFVLAVREGRLLGFAEVNANSPSPPPSDAGEVELARLYVQPGVQRQGIGAALLHGAEDLARKAGARHLWLTVWAGNEAAISFYRASSYRELGTTHFMIGNSSYENCLMARQIP